MKEKENLYLEEDGDLLAMVDSDIRGSYEMQKQTLDRVQIKAILRNRKELRDFNKTIEKANGSAKRVSIVLVAIGLIQAMVAISQFTFVVQSGSDKLLGLFWIVILAISIFVVIKGLSIDKT